MFRRLAALFTLGTLVGVSSLAASCTPQGDPAIGPDGYSDDFEREDLGELWNNTGASWRITDGELVIRNARNRPLWLRRALPRDVRIEFDVRSMSTEGDIKCEIFGDGTSRATTDSYTATSYVVIFGGWGNRYNVIARMDEHAPDRRQRVGPRVEMGRHYHFTIERRGRVLRWLLDGAPMLEWLSLIHI